MAEYTPLFPNASDMPIARIARQREEILEKVIENSLENVVDHYPKNFAIRQEIAKTLYLERIRIRNESWEVDPEDEPQFWSEIKKSYAKSDPNLTSKEEALRIEKEMARKIISRYAHEIISNFDTKVYKFAEQFLPRFFGRLLNGTTLGWRGFFSPKVLLENRLFVTGPIDKIRKLTQKGTVILVPTHFSNLDSIIIGFGMHTIGLPAFQYGAGLNLFNSKLIAFFMGNLGAYKLDRRKKNPIYLETLKAFSRVNILAGANTIFFPGGTRSRSGAIEKDLKLGLLGTVLEAQRIHYENNTSEAATKIFILPLTTSYHFVLEASSLIEEELKRSGKEQFILPDDQFSNWKAWIKFFKELFLNSSEITLSLSEPMDVFGNKLDDEGNSVDNFGNIIPIQNYFSTKGKLRADEQREQEYTRLLGDILVEKFHTGNTVYSSHMVCFTAFEIIKQRNKVLDLYSLLRLPEEDREINWDDFVFTCSRVRDEIYNLNNNNKLKIAPHITGDIEEVIAHGIRNVGMYHAQVPIFKLENGNMSSEDMKLLFYYHNRLEGYELHRHI
jgi:glycerol-3-phosphate O-acyltransferase